MFKSIGEFTSTGPFPLVFLTLTLLVASRSNLVYGIGRYGRRVTISGREPSGGFRRRAWQWANTARTQRAMDKIKKRGWIVISLAYLTIGIQTVVNVAAGVVGLSWPKYNLAAFPGWLAWALIYSTVGFAVWNAAVAAAAGSPAGIAVVCSFALAAAVGCTLSHRRKNVAAANPRTLPWHQPPRFKGQSTRSERTLRRGLGGALSGALQPRPMSPPTGLETLPSGFGNAPADAGT